MAGLTKTIARLIKAGFPEGTAYKIATGELDMSNAARMSRADEQGYLTDAYHATDRDISKFEKSAQPRMSAGRSDASLGGNWFTSSADNASANYANDPYPPPMHTEVGQNILPVRLKIDDAAVYDDPTGSPFLRSGAIKREKRKRLAERPDGIAFKYENGVEDTFVPDPANVRSRFAAFDPDNAGKKEILGSARPDLLAATALGTAGALAAPLAYNALQEQYHGVLAAPEHPNVLRAADALRGLSRRLEGSPAGILAPDATAEWLGKLAYQQKPTWMDRISAIGDWL